MLFPKEPVLGLDTTYKHFTMLSADMVILSQVKGWKERLPFVRRNLRGDLHHRSIAPSGALKTLPFLNIWPLL